MAYLIAICGGSGSGKTFLAEHLLKELGDDASRLSYDSYYRDQSSLPFEERGKLNYDDPSVMDQDLFLAHLSLIRKGQEVAIPQYDFVTHTRKKETRLFAPTPIVLIDGVLVGALPNLKSLFDFIIYVDAESDIRLARRIIRDEKERGRSGTSVIEQYLKTVRPMHKKYVEPARNYADFVFVNDENNGLDEGEMRQLVTLLKRASRKED
jgi:uridine kinase